MAGQKLGSPIDLSKFMGKARNRVYKVGVELEGGWDKLPPRTQLVHDGSVRFKVPTPTLNHVGELPSPPLVLSEKEATKSGETWFPKWMQVFYPAHVNETCGMHVHLSMKTAFSYQKLMTPAYPATIVAYMTKWAEAEKLPKEHPIWPRLMGKNEYCQHLFYADDQAKTGSKDYDHNREGHRYTVVVYCWARHSTLECRLLPMMDNVEQAIKAVQEIIDITNAFLLVTAGREERVTAAHKLEDDEVVEVKRLLA